MKDIAYKIQLRFLSIVIIISSITVIISSIII